MASSKLPKTITVATTQGDAIAEATESDLNGGWRWHLQHPWGDVIFAGTAREARSRLTRVCRNMEKGDAQ